MRSEEIFGHSGYLLCHIQYMTADGLVMQGAMASAALVLALFSHTISVNSLRPRQMAAIFQTTFSNAFS